MLILVPLIPSEGSAIAILCSRYTISQMDVGTRNAYVMGLVHESERSAASGVTNIVRSIGPRPYLAGSLYERPATRDYPFFIADGLKIMYDLLLLWAFSSVKVEGEHNLQPGGGRGVKMDQRTPLQGITVKM